MHDLNPASYVVNTYGTLIDQLHVGTKELDYSDVTTGSSGCRLQCTAFNVEMGSSNV